jgi:hypothetical protein
MYNIPTRIFITRESDDELRQCGKTWESEENGHFSFNNGANSSWIRNSAISYKKNKVWFVYKYWLNLSF